MSPIKRLSSLFWGSHNLKQAVGILFVLAGNHMHIRRLSFLMGRIRLGS
jgi:hypothetical protein